MLHLHIDLQCAAQTGHKQVGLLPFGDVVAAGELGEELVDEVVDRTRPAELGQFAEGVAADGWPEATVDGLNELRPRWNAAITLQPKVPSGGCLVEVEGCRLGLVRLRGAIGLEALLAFVQPDCRIVLAVVVGELELVRGRWMGDGGSDPEASNWFVGNFSRTRVWIRLTATSSAEYWFLTWLISWVLSSTARRRLSSLALMSAGTWASAMADRGGAG